MKTAVQIDFDGTVTEGDISYLLLDTYAGDQWRKYLKEYIEGRISVGFFNREVFSMVKADRQTMTDLVLSRDVKIRLGFKELIDYCSQKGYKTVIVSNGLTFYIELMLEKLGINGVEVHASENEFNSEGMKAKYVGPDGKEMDTGFKEAYTKLLIEKGYDIVYIGDGMSDIYPARRASHVFAIDDLLMRCRAEGIDCVTFTDFFDVIKGLQALDLD